MNRLFSCLFTAGGIFATASAPFLSALSAAESEQPYKVINTAKVGGSGGFDYVHADAEGRRLYIPRGDRVTVFDLDTLKPVGEISGTASVHGAATASKSHRGFSSSKPVVMWDTQTLATIKTIEVQGNPDGILCDQSSGRVYVLSHRAPNVTVIDGKDGSIVGTADLDGAPEQAASDGKGHLYIDIEDKDRVAVLDTQTLKVTASYDLGGKGGTPAGLALDAKNELLFVCCRNPATCVVLSAKDGKILASLPIGAGTDGAAFNAATMELFSSQRDGTVSVIKENSATDFQVEQTVQTKLGAKTCSLDTKTNHLFLITAEYGPPPASSPAPAAGGDAGARPARPARGAMLADSFSILVVGK